MPSYNYRARDNAGKSVKGTMEASAKAELIDKLRNMGYMATSVTDAASGIQIASVFDRLKWISSNDLLIFYIQLSNMISAGITILMSLSTLSRQVENKVFREAIDDVAKHVESGGTLSQGFATHSKIFSTLFINMIKAGEASGNLDKVLLRYADFYERQADLKEKVKGALFYPAILLCAGIAVMLFIVTAVIPQFAEIYMRANIPLPVPTLIVYTIGTAIRHYWYFLIILVVAAAIGIRYYFTTRTGILFMDTLKLRLPIIGPLYRKIAVARFARTLSTLLGSGVPILESLDITKDVTGNVVLERAIANVRKYVEKGERMSEPMKISGEFPPDVVQMVAVGEETGAVDSMLNKIADFYDMTVGYAVKKLTVVIEPVFLVILGCMVGFILASMLLPIFDMVKTLRH